MRKRKNWPKAGQEAEDDDEAEYGCTADDDEDMDYNVPGYNEWLAGLTASESEDLFKACKAIEDERPTGYNEWLAGLTVSSLRICQPARR
jgi:hypothetical protein